MLLPQSHCSMPLPRPPILTEDIPNGPFSFVEETPQILGDDQNAPAEALKGGRRKRARFDNGRFFGDDPTTETVNEAWVQLPSEQEQGE
jgi:hypothetical protein